MTIVKSLLSYITHTHSNTFTKIQSYMYTSGYQLFNFTLKDSSHFISTLIHGNVWIVHACLCVCFIDKKINKNAILWELLSHCCPRVNMVTAQSYLATFLAIFWQESTNTSKWAARLLMIFIVE